MCWVCPVDFDDRREILSLSLKTVVVHNSVKSLKKIFCPTRSPDDCSYRERHLRFLFKLPAFTFRRTVDSFASQMLLIFDSIFLQ